MVIKSQGMKSLRNYDSMKSDESSFKVAQASPRSFQNQLSQRSVKNLGSMDLMLNNASSPEG